MSSQMPIVFSERIDTQQKIGFAFQSIKRCKLDCKGTAVVVERVRDSLFPEDAGK